MPVGWAVEGADRRGRVPAARSRPARRRSASAPARSRGSAVVQYSCTLLTTARMRQSSCSFASARSGSARASRPARPCRRTGRRGRRARRAAAEPRISAEEHDREDDDERHDPAAPERHRACRPRAAAAVGPRPATGRAWRPSGTACRVSYPGTGAANSLPARSARANAELVPPRTDSALALSLSPARADAARRSTSRQLDTLLYVAAGSARSRSAGDDRRARAGSRSARPRGRGGGGRAAAPDARRSSEVTVGRAPTATRPSAPRETVVAPRPAGSRAGDGARARSRSSSGRTTARPGRRSSPASSRPGRAPWHYHLYDEIVWVPRGPGGVHLGEGVGGRSGPGRRSGCARARSTSSRTRARTGR